MTWQQALHISSSASAHHANRDIGKGEAYRDGFTYGSIGGLRGQGVTLLGSGQNDRILWSLTWTGTLTIFARSLGEDEEVPNITCIFYTAIFYQKPQNLR